MVRVARDQLDALRLELLSFERVADFEGAALIYRRCRAAGVTPRGLLDCMIAAVQTGAQLAARSARVTYWPAQLCVLGAILLQVRLPEKVTVGPTWMLPALEGALLIGLAATTPSGRADEDHPVRRRIALGLIAFVNAANAASL